MVYSYMQIQSPVGLLKAVASPRGVRAVLWPEEKPKRVLLGEVEIFRKSTHGRETHRHFAQLEKQLAEYFENKRRAFDLELDWVGTDFQVSVWRALLKIKMGETLTYGEVAKRVGRPLSSRAVGAAIGRNPISIVVPCHRVIGASGMLTGFAGGLKAKSFLLTHESARFQRGKDD
jgi:methylated-DNA-[protein]-cysteine S-methyltransferase